MMIVFMTILKKLAAICRRVLNRDPCRIFRQSAVAPVWTTGHTATERRKVRIRKLGNNGYSVLGTLILEGEKPPPFAARSPLIDRLLLLRPALNCCPCRYPQGSSIRKDWFVPYGTVR
jgi:hypothetical protein